MLTLARVIAEAEPLTHTLHGLFDQFLRQAPPSSASLHLRQAGAVPADRLHDRQRCACAAAWT